MPSHPLRRGPPVGCFSSRFDAEVDELASRRRDFVDWLKVAEVDGDAADDLEVVFSEVTANAVSASPSTADVVRVDARLTRGMFVLQVSNRTRGDDDLPRPAAEGEDELRERGRGLLIVRAYVDSVRTQAVAPDRFMVRCCRRLAPAG